VDGLPSALYFPYTKKPTTIKELNMTTKTKKTATKNIDWEKQLLALVDSL